MAQPVGFEPTTSAFGGRPATWKIVKNQCVLALFSAVRSSILPLAAAEALDVRWM